MPKLEPKTIYKELEQGRVRPFYWIYGPERLKARELIKRIRSALGVSSLSEESFEGSQISVDSLLDSAKSLSLLGGVRFIQIQDAHALKNPEALTELMGPAISPSELNCVCIALAKDWDGRKKISKLLLDHAAVVPCEEVIEAQKEPWIQYLAKRRGMALKPARVLHFCSLEPWSLDRIDLELEKLSISEAGPFEAVESEESLSPAEEASGADVFIESFFGRKLKTALSAVAPISQKPEEALPLLGLLGWNVKQFVMYQASQSHGSQFSGNPYLIERLKRWSPHWKLSELIELQHDLVELDYSLKQTPLLPLGAWSTLVMRYC